MKKRFLLFMMTALLSVGAWATDDVTLTFSDIVLGWNGGGGTKNAETNTLTVVEDEWSGWNFELGRPVSTTEFSGISIDCGEVTDLQLVIFYESDQNWSKIQQVTEITNGSTINFDKTGTIASIVFGGAKSSGSIVINSVTLKGRSEALATVPTANLTLPFNKMNAGDWGVTSDNENHKKTIQQWAASGWKFYLPLPTSIYKGIDFTLTEIPATGGKITIEYTEGENQEISLTSTSVNVDFSRSGYVSAIKFNGDGWHAEDEEPLGDLTYGIGDCYVVARPITATVTDAKYATFAVGAAIDYSSAAPSGLKAYIAYVEDNKVKLTEVTKVPANTAVVLFADVDSNTEYTLTATAETTDDVSDNALLISDGTVTGDGSTIYVLANGGSGVGFYCVDNGSAIPADKAYLNVTGGAAPQFFGFGFGDDTTGVSVIDNEKLTANDYYDLQGRRVAQPTKGLYIVRSAEGRLQGKNGKKVVIK